MATSGNIDNMVFALAVGDSGHVLTQRLVVEEYFGHFAALFVTETHVLQSEASPG